LARLDPDAEPQAEFVCAANDEAAYRPVKILDFEALGRDAFDWAGKGRPELSGSPPAYRKR
jgi:hypothetical protein